jgi:hypothetical protein
LFLPCLRALKDAAFAKETITKEKVEHPALRNADEVVVNAIFRYLQVRGYVDDQHNLTTWGKALEAALEVADEEYTIVGIEMLRMGLFTGNFASGDPVSKTGLWNRCCSWILLTELQTRITIGRSTPTSSPRLRV